MPKSLAIKIQPASDLKSQQFESLRLQLRFQSLLFFDFLACFFLFSDFLAFWGAFPFFSKDFRGSAKRKTIFLFSGGFPCCFFKKARVGGSGIQKSKGGRVRDFQQIQRRFACDFAEPSAISNRASRLLRLEIAATAIFRFGHLRPRHPKCSKSHDLVRLRFEGLGAAILLRFDKGFKSQIARFELRFEAFLTAIWGIFFRFGLRDLKSLAICDLEHLVDTPRRPIMSIFPRKSGSWERGRCRRGWSETPHFFKKIAVLFPCPRRMTEITRKYGKAKKNEEKRNKKKRRKTKKKSPTPSTPTPLRSSQEN